MFKIFALFIFTLFSVLVFGSSGSAQFPIGGQVVDVIDGKTVLVAVQGGQVKVELQYIDVPDAGQELHDTVKEHLRTLLMGKSIEYRPRTIFRDHAVGQVTLRSLDISQQMLRDGAAWHVPRESSGQDKAEAAVYATMEAEAKKDNIGVWSTSGLKPAWEFRAENLAKAKAWQQEQFNMASSSRTAVVKRKLVAKPQGGNPALANVGALINLYDPESKTGILSTSYMPIALDKAATEVESLGIDITYYYKEDKSGNRNGSFVFTAYFQSRAPQLLTNNNLIIWDNDKKTNLGKPKRKVSRNGFTITEALIYNVPRNILERTVNNEGVYFKIGPHMIYATGGRYLLYNLLDVTR